MPKQSTYTWTHVNARLRNLEKGDFLLLLHDLYALNADNRLFLTTRLLTGTPAEMVAPYRKAISQVFNPDRGLPSLQLRVARKAVNDFKKLCHDPLPVIDLMLFYVEEGVTCARSYGNLDLPVYRSLASVYLEAAERTANLGDPATTEGLRPRFAQLVRDAADLGWGLHDELINIYLSYLPPDDDESI